MQGKWFSILQVFNLEFTLDKKKKAHRGDFGSSFHKSLARHWCVSLWRMSLTPYYISGLGWEPMDILLKSVRAWEMSRRCTVITCYWGNGVFHFQNAPDSVIYD